MNQFQQFLADKPFGFLKDTDIAELTRLHRLCQCLIRYGCGRCICSAQDVPGMVKMIEKSGDYVRDVSVTVPEMENAHKWQAEPTFTVPHTTPEQRKAILAMAKPDPYLKPPKRVCGPDFDESDCGGVFDGFGVVSDADPGL